MGPELRAYLRDVASVSGVACEYDGGDLDEYETEAFVGDDTVHEEAESRGLTTNIECDLCPFDHPQLTPLGRIALRLPQDCAVTT